MRSGKYYLAFLAIFLCVLFGRVDAATDPLSHVNRLPESLETVVRQVGDERARLSHDSSADLFVYAIQKVAAGCWPRTRVVALRRSWATITRSPSGVTSALSNTGVGESA